MDVSIAQYRAIPGYVIADGPQKGRDFDPRNRSKGVGLITPGPPSVGSITRHHYLFTHLFSSLPVIFSRRVLRGVHSDFRSCFEFDAEV